MALLIIHLDAVVPEIAREFSDRGTNAVNGSHSVRKVSITNALAELDMNGCDNNKPVEDSKVKRSLVSRVSASGGTRTFGGGGEFFRRR